ncbi:RHS repeat-associated core domain-containing protein [Streptomyces sp. NPDC006012]|uniref:RHS repeat-associated core domain-containing protein n=1 Tax=Streptomyces sp. NPDC006012 TaxID=3364739 RepID=UPI0036BE9325
MQRLGAVGVALGLIPPLLSVSMATAAVAAPLGRPDVPKPHVSKVFPFDSTKGEGAAAAAAKGRAADGVLAARALKEQTAPVAWPKAATATLTLAAGGHARVKPGSLPVTVTSLAKPSAAKAKAGARAKAKSGTGSKSGVATASGAVKVSVLDQKAAERAGVTGVVLSAQAEHAGTAQLSVSYSAFAGAFGGDWAGRLRLVELPACALTTPQQARCRHQTPLNSRNDVGSQQVRAEVDLPATPEPGAAVSSSSGPVVLALAASATGASATGSGNPSATPLGASSTWEAGGSSGSFTWNYPLRTPAAAAGPAPDLSISYDSGSIDGQTANTNNQGTQIGEGFDLPSSYVERRYSSCDDDGQDDKQDQCWKYDNASLVLNGKASELVKDDTTGTWRLKDDDASTVTHSTGADNGDEGDADIDGAGEYWTVTTGDGTKYVFGKDKLPGANTERTNSVWTVPVFGDDSGEPGYSKGSAFADRSVNQAWRWNLDYVVDTHDNAMSYWYAKETNYYAKNGDDSPTTEYVRGGYLKEIRYGQRAGLLFATGTDADSPEKVTFDYAERCLAADCSSLTKDTAKNWPDVPFDAICDQGKDCAANTGPSFFTRKRLTGIHTYTWDTRKSPASLQQVDSWTLKHKYLDYGDTGDSSDQTLVPDQIQHTGYGSGATLSLEPVTFTYQDRANRVDTNNDDILPMTKPRIKTITSETGQVTTVSFSGPECSYAAGLPAPDANTSACYPVYWHINGSAEQKLDWFQKYRVITVEDADPTGHSDAVQTAYTYDDGGAWHYNDDPFTENTYRTWSVWRGYGKVTATTGTGSTVSKTVSVFLRGMDGDRQVNADGTADTPRKVSVTGIKSGALTDKDEYAGFLREQVVYNGAAEVSGTINAPWSTKTATQHKSYADIEAYMVRTGTAKNWTRATSTGTPVDRSTTTTTTFDDYGMPATAQTSGDGIPTTCTRTWYARNPSAGITTLTSRVRAVARPCATAETDLNLPADDKSQGDVVSDTATVYDTAGATAWSQNQVPTKGETTWTGRATGYPAAATGGERPPSWQTVTTITGYDGLGRPSTVADANGNTTVTKYTPPATGSLVAAVGPLTRTDVTNATKAQTTITLIDPFWSLPFKSQDMNGKISKQGYDALGRLTDVWRPDRSGSDTPNTSYAYSVTADKPSWVSTKTLNADGRTYTTSYQIYDAKLRPLQTQTPSPLGGRIITDTRYDDRGLVTESYADVYDNTSGPTGERMGVQYAGAPSQTETVFDGAGRPTTSTFLVRGVKRWSTTTSYTGDSTATTAVDGGSASRTFTDVLGRTTETRQYAGTNPDSNTSYTSTTFTYTPGSAPQTVTAEADGTTWSYRYDLYGRQTSATDPDKGTTTTSYNKLDQVASTQDANHNVLSYAYDALGRKTNEWNTTTQTDANKLANWTYDTVTGGKGQPATSTRYVGGADSTGKAYTRAVTHYDSVYRPTDTTLTLPSTDPLVTAGVPATLAFHTDYNVDGSVNAAFDPAVAGLDSEGVTYHYNTLGQITGSQGISGYLLDTSYSELGDPLQLSLGQSVNNPNKAFITNHYEDGTRRLTDSIVTDTTHPYQLQNLQYGYDDVGNVTHIFDPTTLGGTSKADNQCFTYDGYRRQSEAWTPTTPDCSTTNRTTANLGGPAPYWTSNTYTDSGLRTTETTHTPAATTKTTYCYDTKRPHALTTTTTSTATAPCTGLTPTYVYDDSGNTTTRPGPKNPQTLHWDTEGKLSTVTDAAPGTADTSYLYDADGSLLIRRPTNATGNGETVLYLGTTEVHLTVTGTTKKLYGLRYYTAGSQTIALRSNQASNGGTATTLTFLAADQHSTSSLAIESTTQAITKRYTTPFGADRGTPLYGPWPDDKGFLGKPADTTTGLTHIGAREYDPTTGRFISVDPLLETDKPQTLNGYTYSANNPVTFSDPTGEGLACGQGFDVGCGDGVVTRGDGSLSKNGKPTGGGVLKGWAHTGNSGGTATAGSDSKKSSDSGQSWLSTIKDTIADVGSVLFSQPEIWWGATETVGSIFLMGFGGDTVLGGAALCTTVVGCFAGAPAIAGGLTISSVGAAGAGDGIGRINEGLGTALREASSESSGGSRTFTSDDPLVGDLATSIEAKYPGLVEDVNVPVNRADGSTLTDFDIELKNAVIQVKAGPGKGAGAQVTRTQEGTDKPVIVYGPKLRPAVVKEVNSRGGIGVTSMDDLLSVIAP